MGHRRWRCFPARAVWPPLDCCDRVAVAGNLGRRTRPCQVWRWDICSLRTATIFAFLIRSVSCYRVCRPLSAVARRQAADDLAWRFLNCKRGSSMDKSSALVIAALVLAAAPTAEAQQPQLPQSPTMTFFVTSVGPGKGG